MLLTSSMLLSSIPESRLEVYPGMSWSSNELGELVRAVGAEKVGNIPPDVAGNRLLSDGLDVASPMLSTGVDGVWRGSWGVAGGEEN